MSWRVRDRGPPATLLDCTLTLKELTMGFGIGPPEMLLFGMIALLLFGKRLPEVARSLGQGLTEFKKGMRGVEDDFRSV